MKKIALLLVCSLLLGTMVVPVGAETANTTLPTKAEVVEVIRRVNDWWIEQHPEPGVSAAYTNEKNPSNGWAISVYFLGNMAAYDATKDAKYAEYAFQWAERYKWGIYAGNIKSQNADSQCCFGTYYQLSKIDPQRADLTKLKTNMETVLADTRNDYWSWVDAAFMVSQLYMQLYKDTGDARYLEKTNALFKDTMITRQFYDESEGLIYRDAKFFYPGYKAKNGAKDFWGRGNGWGYAATARILEYIPADYKDRGIYLDIIQNMAQALRETQQPDGFWRASILDPVNYTQPETSGTSLLAYGLAKAINNGWIDDSYKEVVVKAWNGLLKEAVFESGQVGHSQPGGDRAGKSDKDSTKCFTTGAFLLFAEELSRMADNALWTGNATGADINVYVNGAMPKFDAKPQVVNSRTLIPIRAVSETMGADVAWDANTQTATVTKGDTKIALTIGNAVAKVGDKEVVLDAPAQILENRTFVPLRFVAESLNTKVDWYNDTRTVVITTIPAPLTHDKEMPIPEGTVPTTADSLSVSGKSTAATAPKVEVTGFNSRTTPNATVESIKSAKVKPKTIVGTLDKSPSEAKNSPDKAADGDIATRWACRSTTGSAWLEYEFDAIKKIDALSIAYYNGKGRACAFDIYVSKDGSTWTKVLAAKTTGSGNDLEGFTFSATEAKYVRLIGWGANDGKVDWNSVTELNIYGK